MSPTGLKAAQSAVNTIDNSEAQNRLKSEIEKCRQTYFHDYYGHKSKGKKQESRFHACVSRVMMAKMKLKFLIAECGRLVMYQVPGSAVTVMCWKWHGGGGEVRGDGGVAQARGCYKTA